MEFKHTRLPIELELPKLVRDNIPDSIRKSDGIEPQVEVAEDDNLFTKYILKKLVEETVEMSREAENNEELKKELCDIMELVHTLANLKGFSLEEIDEIRKTKKEKNGGFEKRYILVSR